MYSVRFLRVTPKGVKLESITHANLEVAKLVHDALRISGIHVRLWDGDFMVKPAPRTPRLRHYTPALGFIGVV